MKKPSSISYLVLAIAFSLLYIIKDAAPIVRLFYASVALIFIIKVASLLLQTNNFKSKIGLLSYLFLWPGVSTKGFTNCLAEPPKDTGERFIEHWLSFVFGSILLFGISYVGEGKSVYLNYAALFSILLIVHLGLVEIVRDFLKLVGFNPNIMFDRPYRANSLKNFWSVRWNRAFVEMNKIFLLKPLKGKVPDGVLVFSIFLISGLLHEMAISYTSGSGYGGPLIYFIIQGVGFLIERQVRFGRVGTLLIVILPLPLLFPVEFVNLFIGSLSSFIAVTVKGLTVDKKNSLLLLGGGVLQLCVLFASFQVPSKLDWYKDLKKLSNFNRKIFWTYGGYILSIIIFMSIISIVLSQTGIESLAAKAWILFIILFWVARVLIDMFYYSSEDWPKGPEFTIGHICLTTLFITLICIYSLVLFLSYQL